MRGRLVFLLSLLCVAQALPLSLSGEQHKELTRSKRHAHRDRIRSDIADREVRTIISAIVDAILDGDRKKRSEIPEEDDDDFEKDGTSFAVKDTSDVTKHELKDTDSNGEANNKSGNKSSESQNKAKKKTVGNLSESSGDTESGDPNNDKLSGHEQLVSGNSELGSGSGLAFFHDPGIDEDENASKKSLVSDKYDSESGSGQYENSSNSKKTLIENYIKSDSDDSGSGESGNGSDNASKKLLVKNEISHVSGSGESGSEETNDESLEKQKTNLIKNDDELSSGDTTNTKKTLDINGSGESGEDSQSGDTGELREFDLERPDDSEGISLENAGFIVEPKEKVRNDNFDFGRAKRDEEGQDLQDKKEKKIFETMYKREDIQNTGNASTAAMEINIDNNTNKYLLSEKTNNSFLANNSEHENSLVDIPSNTTANLTLLGENVTSNSLISVLNNSNIANNFSLGINNDNNINSTSRKNVTNISQRSQVTELSPDSNNAESGSKSHEEFGSGSGSESGSNEEQIAESGEASNVGVRNTQEKKRERISFQPHTFVKRSQTSGEDLMDIRSNKIENKADSGTEESGNESDNESGNDSSSGNADDSSELLVMPNAQKTAQGKKTKGNVTENDSESGSGIPWDDSSGYGFGSAAGGKRGSVIPRNERYGTLNGNQTSNKVAAFLNNLQSSVRNARYTQFQSNDNSEEDDSEYEVAPPSSTTNSEVGDDTDDTSGEENTVDDSQKKESKSLKNTVIKAGVKPLSIDNEYPTSFGSRDHSSITKEPAGGGRESNNGRNEKNQGDESLIRVDDEFEESGSGTDLAKVSNTNGPIAVEMGSGSVNRSTAKEKSGNSSTNQNTVENIVELEVSGSGSGSGNISTTEDDEENSESAQKDERVFKENAINTNKSSNSHESSKANQNQRHVFYVKNFGANRNDFLYNNVGYSNKLPNVLSNVSVSAGNTTIPYIGQYHDSLGKTGKPENIFGNKANTKIIKTRQGKKINKKKEQFDFEKDGKTGTENEDQNETENDDNSMDEDEMEKGKLVESATEDEGEEKGEEKDSDNDQEADEENTDIAANEFENEGKLEDKMNKSLKNKTKNKDELKSNRTTNINKNKEEFTRKKKKKKEEGIKIQYQVNTEYENVTEGTGNDESSADDDANESDEEDEADNGSKVMVEINSNGEDNNDEKSDEKNSSEADENNEKVSENDESSEKDSSKNDESNKQDSTENEESNEKEVSEDKESKGKDSNEGTESNEKELSENKENNEKDSSENEINIEKESNENEQSSEKDSSENEENNENETSKNEEGNETDSNKAEKNNEKESSDATESNEKESSENEEGNERESSENKESNEKESSKNKESDEEETTENKENNEKKVSENKESDNNEPGENGESNEKEASQNKEGNENEASENDENVSTERPQSELKESKDENEKDITKRAKIIEEIVTDMAKAAIQSVEVDDSDSVVKKSFINGSDNSNQGDGKTEETDKAHESSQYAKRRGLAKTADKDEITSNMKRLVHTLVKEDPAIRANIRYIAEKRKKAEEKLADEILRVLNKDMETGTEKPQKSLLRKQEKVMSEIKDFEGYVGALSASESLTPMQHQLITKKLEKDLLHHLSLSKKEYSRAILKSEEKLATESELESIKRNIAATQRSSKEFARKHANSIEDVRRHVVALLTPVVQSVPISQTDFDELTNSISSAAWNTMLKRTKKNNIISKKVRRNLEELLNLS